MGKNLKEPHEIANKIKRKDVLEKRKIEKKKLRK